MRVITRDDFNGMIIIICLLNKMKKQMQNGKGLLIGKVSPPDEA